MPYVPGFEYDLFLSYASDDFDGKLEGFVRDLRVFLRRELGKDFSQERGIFLDRQELNRTPTEWKLNLQTSAGAAAMLVPVLTPSYVTSEYCAKEWEWFRENPPLNWTAGAASVYRVCPVRWREVDADLLRQLSPEIRSAQEHRSLSVEDLALRLANGLRLMRRSRQCVYLGESEHDVRRKVRDEISRMGFRIVPEALSAHEDPETVRTFLGEARLAVHFVGGQESQRPIEAIRWSREHCQHATVVYEIPGVDLSFEEKVSLEWIEEDLRKLSADDSRAYDRISGKNKNVDQFLQVMRDRLEGARPLPPTQVGIACEENDRQAVESIIPEIQVKTGFSVTCHGMSLLDFKKSRGLLLYWGTADGGRLRQARHIVKAYFAFFLAPPPKPEDRKAELAGCPILNQSTERFQIEDIRPFLERLGWRG
jgi:hypothetical protein